MKNSKRWGRNSLYPLAVLSAVVGIAGCTTMPQNAPDVELPATYSEAASVVGNGVSALPLLDNWWVALNDVEINRLVADAYAASPTAQKAMAVLREAQAVRQGALSGFLPQGTVSASQAREGSKLGDLGEPTSVYSAPLSWEVDLLARSGTTRDIANATYASSEIAYHSSRASLAAEVVRSVIQVRGLTRQINDARDAQRIAEDLLRVGRLKVERGLQGSADIASLEGDLASQQAALVQLTANRSVAQRQLKVLLGRGREGLDVMAENDALPAIPQMPLSVPSDLLRRRPDIRQAELDLIKASGNAFLAKKAFFPTIFLKPTVSETRSSGLALTSWSVAGALTQPLLDIPRLRSALRAQNARVDQAVLAYEQAVQSGYAEVENGLTAYTADQERMRQLQIAEARARQAFDAETLRYRAGYSDLTSLLQRETIWRTARSTLTSAEIEALNTTITLFQSLGAGWAPQGTGELRVTQNP